MSFELPALPFKYDALQPFMSSETLEYHHDKHHLTYLNNLNNLIKGTEFEGKSLEDIVKASFGKNVPVFNNAGQHYNHSLFWNSIKPGGSKVPGKLEAAIIATFGSVEKAKEELATAAVTQFGSGWAWLSVTDGKLAITKTSNAETPLANGSTPLLTIDVWEHAYYIDYRNRRPDFVKTFLDNLANWEFAAAEYEKAVG